MTIAPGTPNLRIGLDGLKTVVEVYAERADLNGPPPSPEKYVDLSYLDDALATMK